jgi:trehalose 6-phosphate phosphatase
MMAIAEVRPDIPTEAPPKFDLNRTALFLDLDGTLAPIEETPDAVGPDPHRTSVLKLLADAMEGRLAVLSGRSIAEVDRILEGSVASVAGLHGLERRRADGSLDSTAPHAALAEAAAVFDGLAKAQFGLLVERKGASVALHYRKVPQCGPAVLEAARRLSREHGLYLQEGRMVAELRTPGPDKGEALRVFMSEPEFRGGAPLMIGDDLTDEDAFEAAIAAGGQAILVGPPRPSHARWRLSSPAALLAWLEAALPDHRPLPLPAVEETLS